MVKAGKSSCAAKEHGESADPADISKMLGIMKYHAKRPDSDHSEAAARALAVNKSLSSPSQRATFLTDFEVNGGGKTAGSFEWVLSFQKSLTNTGTSATGCVENMFTRFPHTCCVTPLKVITVCPHFSYFYVFQ